MTKRTPGPDPFNNPFGKVKLTEPEQPAVKAPPPKQKPKPIEPDSESAMFLEAMGQMEPVKPGKSRVPPPDRPRADPVKLQHEESESLAQLAELVLGDTAIEVTDCEGQVRGFDPQVLRRLRAGEFARRAQLDLHGLTRDQAQQALEKFIPASRTAGHRCVLVITGRGLHSDDQVPILKANLQGWLVKGRLARHLLAFCEALPSDGGSGAAYVLLRR